jgi:rhodanese-related sulfurtransferase
MPGVEEVDPLEARRLLDAGALLVDVREPAEWHEGHAPGSLPLPLRIILQEEASVPAGRRIVAACRNGRRSFLAAIYLTARGHVVFSLAGGLNEWVAQGFPVIRPDGSPGVVVIEEGSRAHSV